MEAYFCREISFEEVWSGLKWLDLHCEVVWSGLKWLDLHREVVWSGLKWFEVVGFPGIPHGESPWWIPMGIPIRITEHVRISFLDGLEDYYSMGWDDL